MLIMVPHDVLRVDERQVGRKELSTIEFECLPKQTDGSKDDKF